jgi:hypothetical protein
MNSKLRRSEMKISGLFYDIIPVLYWNGKENQINLEWCIGSSAICRRITGWLFSKISSKILVMAFENKTRILPRNFVNKLPRDTATYHGRKYSSFTSLLGLNTRKDILVRTSSFFTPKLSQESRLPYPGTRQPPTSKRYSLFLLWGFRSYNVTS